MNWFQRAVMNCRIEWWRLWPHRFDHWRGSANCGRCNVPYDVHRHMEDL